MKKLLLGTASLLLLASCSGKNDASLKAGENSNHTYDSIVQVDMQRVIAEHANPETDPRS